MILEKEIEKRNDELSDKSRNDTQKVPV